MSDYEELDIDKERYEKAEIIAHERGISVDDYLNRVLGEKVSSDIREIFKGCDCMKGIIDYSSN